MKIRTITVGSLIYSSEDLLPLVVKARLAQEFFKDHKYEVQTIQIATSNLCDEKLIDELNTIYKNRPKLHELQLLNYQ